MEWLVSAVCLQTERVSSLVRFHLAEVKMALRGVDMGDGRALALPMPRFPLSTWDSLSCGHKGSNPEQSCLASLSRLHWASSSLLYRTLRLGHIFISQQRIIWILRIFLCFIEFNSPQSLSEPLFHQSATFPGRTRQRLLLEDRSCLREQAGRAGF